MPLTQLLFILFLLGVGLLRIAELIVSKRRMARSGSAAVPEPWLFPLMAALHAGLIGLPILEVVALDRPFSWWVTGPAATLLSIATLLRIWTLWSLGRAWNVRVVPPSPDQIVTTGPYALIRHPNYLVVILEILALPLLHTAYLAALGLSLLNAVVLWSRIRTEERALEQIPGWAAAMADRKRLIPFVF